MPANCLFQPRYRAHWRNHLTPSAQLISRLNFYLCPNIGFSDSTTGNKNSGTNALSGRGFGTEDPSEDEDEADECFDPKLYSIQISDWVLNSPTPRVYLHEADYNGNGLLLASYLETLQGPDRPPAG